MSGSLSVFSDPGSVAVVGASADPAKWGYWLACGALRGRPRRMVHLVNSGEAVIEGVRSTPTVRDLPGPAELVVLCTPPQTAPDVIEDALANGARGFVGITAGIDVTHGPGAERRLAQRIRAAGARLLGPNCLGLYDASHALELTWGNLVPGNLGIVSQSGQLGLEMAGLAAHAGLGISRFVSLGNQVDVSATEVLDDLVEHDATRAVVVYLESFAEGRALVDTMARLRAAGKPVVVLTVGASEASRAAARSHTGALTSAVDVVAAACRAGGGVLVETPAQAIELAHLLVGSPLPSGRRVAVISDSGGQGALAADTLAREGLSIPRLSEATARSLTGLLPVTAAVTNPVDLAGGGERDITAYSRVTDLLAGSGEVDSVVLSGYFGSYGLENAALAARELDVVETLAETVRRHGRPVVVHSMSHDSPAVRSMRALAVPTLHTIDGVARSLSRAADLLDWQPPSSSSRAPAAAAVTVRAGDYLGARDCLAAYGIAFPRGRVVANLADLRAATDQLSSPYVLKAGWLEHKTEAGGVVVGLPDADAAERCFREMSRRLGEGGYVLEEMDRGEHVVELIVGARRDPFFGPLALVGLGGIHAELYRDVAIDLAPVTEAQALRMLRRLKALPILEGWRGRPAVDIDAAARTVAAVSRFLDDQADVVECEVNPVRVGPGGAVGVDALIVTLAGGADPSASAA